MEAHWELDAKNIRVGPLELTGAKEEERGGILGSGEPERSHRRLWEIAWGWGWQALGSLVESSARFTLLL